MLVSINPDNPQKRLLQLVVDQLRNGAVICYPTDTVYGLGCDIYNQKAVKRVHQIKSRPKDKPFSFMCASLKDISSYGHVSNLAYRLMKKHLPGPYTFVLPALKIVPKIMITKQKTVGIRVPANNICLTLLEMLGNPILTTSAARPDTGPPPLVQAFEVEEWFGKTVDLVIDGGPVYPDPSTVISFTGDVPEVLRQGKGDASQFF